MASSMESKIIPYYFVSKEEANHRLTSLDNEVNVKKWYCTSCGSKSVQQEIMKGQLNLHPLLKTIICKNCIRLYDDGEFSVDEDGTDKYCRWCSRGGKLYICSRCPSGFCKVCILRNLPAEISADLKSEKWFCFCCNITPLIELRTQCWSAQQMLRTKKAIKQN